MSHTSDTPMPETRRDLLAILGWLALAVLIYRVGHIPGVVNSATLIAAGSSLWAGVKLVAVLRRMHIRVVAPLHRNSHQEAPPGRSLAPRQRHPIPEG